MSQRDFDVIVVGSGPGGATVARELSRANRKVIICEAGRYHKLYQNKLLGPLVFNSLLSRLGMYFSKEGTWVIVPQTVGGASVIFYGCAAKPPQWLKDRYDIDLSAEVDELYKEIPIKPLPDHLIGERPAESWRKHRAWGSIGNRLTSLCDRTSASLVAVRLTWGTQR